MSNIFFILAKKNPQGNGILNLPFKYKDIHKGPNYAICTTGHKNIYFDHNNLTNQGYALAGFLFANLKSFFAKDLENFYSDGHYTAAKWNSEKLVFATDPLGIREFYLYEDSYKIIITTSLNLIKYYIEPVIDFSEFSTRWLLINQISSNSIFKNLKRINLGTTIKISLKDNRIKLYENNWLPKSDTPFSYKDFEDKLLKYVNPSQTNEMFLSLSGGLDSRVLLALISKSRKNNFTTFTFGHPGHPDCIMADQITKALKIKHIHYKTVLPDVSKCLSLIEEYNDDVFVNNPASSIIFLNYYNQIKENVIVIDGAFGEFWRREFLTKLLLTGRKSLSKGGENILPFFRYNRANIFNEELNSRMINNCTKQLNEALNNYPVNNDPGNWADLFTLKTRFLNYGAPEQKRLDNHIKSYMPFIQPGLLLHLYSIDIKDKKNGKLFKSIIENNYPELTKFKRVKGTSIQPYNLGSVASRILSVYQKKILKKVYVDKSKQEFLSKLKEYVLDTVNSAETKRCDYYDYKAIEQMVQSYYKDNSNYENEVDWFLSFDIFRRSLRKKKFKDQEAIY